MEQWIMGIGGAAALVIGMVFWLKGARARSSPSRPQILTATIFTALSALLFSMLWIHRMEPSVSRVEVLKTGGIVAATVVGLYALWLNDRRRRVEEDRRDIEEKRHEIEHERQQLERGKAEHDRQRVGNEQFARSIELLGHEADQVRVGALHALKAQAIADSSRVQTVLDVLCAYLRRPFEHKDYDDYKDHDLIFEEEDDGSSERPDDSRTPSSWSKEEQATAERERQVRLTAQRLIGEVLRSTQNEVFYDLDLTGAALESFTLSDCNLNKLNLERAAIYLDLTLADAQVGEITLEEAEILHGELGISSSKFSGELNLRFLKASLMIRLIDSEIFGDLSLVGSELNWGARIENVKLHGEFNCRGHLGHGLRLSNFEIDQDQEIKVNDGVAIVSNVDGNITDIYDPDLLASHGLPDPALRKEATRDF